jgi:hypothetical protein
LVPQSILYPVITKYLRLKSVYVREDRLVVWHLFFSLLVSIFAGHFPAFQTLAGSQKETCPCKSYVIISNELV